MSIGSDRWIASQCADANYYFIDEKNQTRFVSRNQLLKTAQEAGELSLLMLVLMASQNNDRTLSLKQFPQTFEKIGNLFNVQIEYLYWNYSDPSPPIVPMIYPFVEQSESTIDYRGNKGKVPSFGLSSFGYDIRLGNRFRVADDRHTPGKAKILDFLSDPEHPDDQSHMFREFEGDSIELLPQSFMLGYSLEWVSIPNNVLAVCMQKSTLARKGCVAYVTPLEPGWFGHITLEIYNATPFPMRLYAGMGIMQLIFHQSPERCAVSYADRNGKYQNQPALPIVAR